jgi:predicted DNA-binding transcriptional regulator AlpA
MSKLNDDDLLTTQEIAEILGVSRATISAYKARRQMPEPDRMFGRTPAWLVSTLKEWRPGAFE